MYVCMYACMYVSMYVCMYVRVYACRPYTAACMQYSIGRLWACIIVVVVVVHVYAVLHVTVSLSVFPVSVCVCGAWVTCLVCGCVGVCCTWVTCLGESHSFLLVPVNLHCRESELD